MFLLLYVVLFEKIHPLNPNPTIEWLQRGFDYLQFLYFKRYNSLIIMVLF